MRTRKVTCPNCKKPFRPGGPWPEPDPELPTAKQASDRFDVGRNFANKLWNAARFRQMHGPCAPEPSLDGLKLSPYSVEVLARRKSSGVVVGRGSQSSIGMASPVGTAAAAGASGAMALAPATEVSVRRPSL